MTGLEFTPHAIETYVIGVIGIGTTLYAAIKHIPTFIKIWKALFSKKEESKEPRLDVIVAKELLDTARAERTLAIKQRDEALALTEHVREINASLHDRVRDMAAEIEEMGSKLMLLTELNRRLAQTLDEAQKQIAPHLRATAANEPLQP